MCAQAVGSHFLISQRVEFCQIFQSILGVKFNLDIYIFFFQKLMSRTKI